MTGTDNNNNNNEDDDDTTTKVWIDPSRDDPSTFRGANSVRDAGKVTPPPDFIAGEGSLGPGLYAATTRDAYEILLRRMKDKAAYRQEQVQYYDDNGMGCFNRCFPIVDKDPPGRQLAVRQLEFATHLVAMVQARLDASGPFVPLTEQAVRRYGGDPDRNSTFSFQDLCEMSVTKRVYRKKAEVKSSNPNFAASMAGACAI